MSFASAAVRLADSLFIKGGSDALWLSGGVGDGMPCKVLHGQQVPVERWGEEAVQLPVGMLRVRKSEIAAPAEDDLVQIKDDDGNIVETRKIVGTPTLDKYRIAWICEAPPVTA